MRKRMKTLMITKVKNEADIIEYFLRYHSNIFDHIVVIDNGSLDGTYEIINALIHEGLSIELINEAYSDFDAFRLANQYTVNLIDKYDAQFVIFMDADEFLIAKDAKNPRVYFESFDDHKLHTFGWRTYIYSGSDNEYFMPESYTKYREEREESFKKIMVPANLVKDKNIVVLAGNHSISSRYNIEEEYHDELKFAHFPVRSLHQRKKQITINILDMIANPNESTHTGSHWKKMYRCDSINLFEESMHYAFYEGNNLIEGAPCLISLRRKYLDYIKDDWETILIEHSEIQALKIKKNRMILNTNHVESIVVWGTGKYADKMLGHIDDGVFIELYVDSDHNKYFSTFHDRIVIPPEKLRFFDFSKIVIASPKNEASIRLQIKNVLPFWREENVYSIDEFIIDRYRK